MLEFGLFWFELLLDMTIKGSVILGTALILLLAFKRMSPASRYLLLFCAVLGILVLPLLIQVLPEWEVSFFPQVLVQKNSITESPISKGLDSPVAGMVSPVNFIPVTEAASWDISWWQIIVMVWWLGVLGVSSRLVLGLIRTWWVRNQAELVSDLDLEAFIKLYAATRPIRLMESKRISIPLAVGWLRPVILVPPEFSFWDKAK